MKRAVFALLLTAAAATAAEEGGWVSLFNGKDLSNWVNVNGAPETWGVKDGVITCTGRPIAALRTPRMYENFEFEVEWRHLKEGGNAGIFVWASPEPAPGQPFLRAIEVQVLDNGYDAGGKNEWYTTHGDVFPIHGATMKPIHKGNGQRCFPSEERSKSAPEWNSYRIVAQNGSLRLSVNGKEVSGGDACVWRKGYLGLESEGSPTEWRNLRLRELPATGATAEQTANEAEGWVSLYNGVDLRGWKATDATAWKASDWNLQTTGGGSPIETPLPKPAKALFFDWRLPKDAAADARVAVNVDGGDSVAVNTVATAALKPAGTWNRTRIEHGDGGWTISHNGAEPSALKLPVNGAVREKVALSSTVATTFGNVFVLAK